MSNISNIENDEELTRKVQGIILNHLYVSKQNNIDSITVHELIERIKAMDSTLVQVDFIMMWNETDWVEIDDNNDFRITPNGELEARNRILNGRLY